MIFSKIKCLIMGEGYIGVKFGVTFVSRSVLDMSILDELLFWCGEFNRQGLAPAHFAGSYGNLSVRYKKGLIITATSLDLGACLSAEDFVYIESFDVDKFMVSVHGAKNPSSETILHAYLYELRPDINAVFHGHSPKILEASVRLGIAQSLNEFPYGTVELVKAAGALSKFNFFNLKNHGFFSLGTTADCAGKMALDMLARL